MNSNMEFFVYRDSFVFLLTKSHPSDTIICKRDGFSPYSFYSSGLLIFFYCQQVIKIFLTVRIMAHQHPGKEDIILARQTALHTFVSSFCISNALASANFIFGAGKVRQMNQAIPLIGTDKENAKRLLSPLCHSSEEASASHNRQQAPGARGGSARNPKDPYMSPRRPPYPPSAYMPPGQGNDMARELLIPAKPVQRFPAAAKSATINLTRQPRGVVGPG